MSTRIFLIRHGATESSAEDRYSGSIEVDLSKEGRAQVSALAERLQGQTIDAFYSSPQARAHETAKVIASPHQKPVTVVEAFREISHGRWEGMTRKEVEKQFPNEYKKWDENPFAFAPAEGESGLSVINRALPALLSLVKSHYGETVLIVSHKATIRLLISTFLGFDPRRFRDHLDQSPSALNILDFSDELHARLTTFNDTAHYTSSQSHVTTRPGPRLSSWWDAKP